MGPEHRKRGRPPRQEQESESGACAWEQRKTRSRCSSSRGRKSRARERMAKVGAVLVVLLFSFVTQISAHARLVCPPPRNPDVGAKLGPCGHPDDLSIEPLELKPGLNTIVFEEAVYHYAA